MPRNTAPKAKTAREGELLRDKPAKTLLRSWGKRMSLGSAAMIPVYVGGSWTLQIPRGNKRMLQVPVKGSKYTR